MPLQIETNIPHSSIQVTIDCSPSQAEMILALAAAVLSGSIDDQNLQALPAALARVGRFLEGRAEDEEFSAWRYPTEDYIQRFSRITQRYEAQLIFNYLQWKDEFMENVYDLAYHEEEDDEKYRITTVIEIVLDTIWFGHPEKAQQELYLGVNGLPEDFWSWIETILSPKIKDKTIATAHYNLIDPQFLRKLAREFMARRSENKNQL